MAIFSQKSKEQTELGFGNKNYHESMRFLNEDGSVNIKRKSNSLFGSIDVFHWLIKIKPGKFLFVLILFYTTVNLFFASIYYLLGSSSFGGLPTPLTNFNLFLQLTFFSSQTITTVGYGHVYPQSNIASMVASTESFIGLLLFAIVTGVLFGRFSRPKSHLLYSRNILITPFKNMNALMFRVANAKQYELLENEAKVILTISNPETNKREFFFLNLEIERISFLALSWTIVHPIDENSPFFGLSTADLQSRDAEIIILLKGTSDTISQTIYSRHSYKPNDLLTGRKFKVIPQVAGRYGQVSIKVDDIHLHEPA